MHFAPMSQQRYRLRMKTFGKRPEGLRLERIKASPLWAGDAFRNVHPIAPTLRDTSGPRPTLSDFLCGGGRRVPRGPLPSFDPREAWTRSPASGLRATWLGHSTVLIEIDGMRILKERFPNLLLIMLTIYDDDERIFNALCAGACGYLLKKTPPAKLAARVRSATADPQTSGHAISGASVSGIRRSESARIFSSPAPAGSI